MSTLQRLCLIVLIALLSPASFVSAQPNTDQRVAELEEENQRLRQELADLRLQVATLKQQLQRLEAAHDQPAEAEGVKQDNGTEQAPGLPAAEGEGDADANAQVRVYESVDEIYRAIPRELSPGRDGWDVVKIQAVEAWLKEAIPGSRYSARKQVSSLRIAYDSIEKNWTVTLGFEAVQSRFMQWGMEERIATVVLRGDQAFADRTRQRLSVGDRVHLTGTIYRAAWDQSRVHPADENWHPTYVSIYLAEAEVRY